MPKVDEKHERTLYAAPGGGWFSTRWEFEEAWREHKERGSSLTATAEPGEGWQNRSRKRNGEMTGWQPGRARHPEAFVDYEERPTPPQPQPADRKGLVDLLAASRKILEHWNSLQDNEWTVDGVTWYPKWPEHNMHADLNALHAAYHDAVPLVGTEPGDVWAESPAEPLSQAPSGCEGWRDIKTAPKDWSNVLLYDPEEEQPVFEGFFSCKDGGRNRWIKGNILSVKPTHWQPLPAPPRSRTDSTEGATKA